MKSRIAVPIDRWLAQHGIMRRLLSHEMVASCYGVFLFLYELKFFREIIPALHPFLIAWAVGVLLYDFLCRPWWEKCSSWMLIKGFAISALLAAVICKDAGLIRNIKTWILSVLPLMTFFPVCFLEKENERKDMLIKVLFGSAVIIFFASFISVMLYLYHYGAHIELFGIREYVGLSLYDRNNPNSGLVLYGVYCDSNHAALYALAFAGYGAILFDMGRRGSFTGWKNAAAMAFGCSSFAVQLCFFPLANSRGAWLCLGVAGFLVALLLWRTRINKSLMLRTGIAFLLSLVTVVGVIGCLLGVREGMSRLSKAVISARIDQNEIEKPSNESGKEETDSAMWPWDDENELDETRAWDSFNKPNERLGAGRIDLWKEALALFLHRPILGTGGENATFYANYYGIGGMLAEGKSVHNSYLDLLVGYGTVGFAMLMSFFAVCFWKTLKNMLNGDYQESTAYCIVAMITLLIAGGAALLSCAFINTTAIYYILLILCGYLLPVSARERRKDIESGI